VDISEGVIMKCKQEGCKAKVMKSSEFCYFHNPELADKRRESQISGGKGRLKLTRAKSKVMTMDDIKKTLSRAIRELENSNYDVVARSRAIGYLSGVLVTTLQVSDFEKRISELEKNLLLSNENGGLE